jgi:cyclophilin family peptidyl-prolyl cis-trans isomerase
MSPRILFASTLLLASCIWLGAQPLAGQDAKPADKLAPTPTAAEFQKVFAQWTDLINRLEQLQIEYKSVKPESRKTIRESFDKLVLEGDKLEPQLIKAAEAAYREAPNKDQDVSDVLVSIVSQDLRDDAYERALPIAKLLVEQKFPNPRIIGDAGIAAYESNDYEDAEKYLHEAEKANALDEMGTNLLKELPKSKEAWVKEKEIRAKEAQADDLPRVELKTTKGTIVLELFENEAPNAVANFISLVDKKFYNGLAFHRVIPHFVAQGGDPKGDGSGGPGYSIACECYAPNHRLHFRGSLSMAHAGRDSGGSQFFLTTVRTPHLDGLHTVFGRVIEGMDVLSELQRREPDPHGGHSSAPADKILEARVLRKRSHAYDPVKIADPAAKEPAAK